MVTPLNPREIILLKLRAKGLTGPEIARELSVNANAVGQAFSRIREKLGGFNAEMVPGIALLLGIVSVEEITESARSFLARQCPDPKLLLPRELRDELERAYRRNRDERRLANELLDQLNAAQDEIRRLAKILEDAPHAYEGVATRGDQAGTPLKSAV